MKSCESFQILLSLSSSTSSRCRRFKLRVLTPAFCISPYIPNAWSGFSLESVQRFTGRRDQQLC